MARAKHTVRAEARRRHRQASAQPEEGSAAELDEEGPAVDARPGGRSTTGGRSNAPAAVRPGFFTAFRGAYHPAHLREDIPYFPKLLQSRAFLAALALTIAGAIAAFGFWDYTGGRFAYELLLLPGSALAPQLVAGFFASRASYFLGFVIGLAQGVLNVLFLVQLAAGAGTPLTGDQSTALLVSSILTGPISGMLFAAAAAWYRRFLQLSSPRRAQAGKGPAGRGSAGKGPAKPAASRRAGR